MVFTIRTDWDGPNVYEDIFWGGRHIGRSWVGGENEEYEGQLGVTTKVTKEEVVAIMGEDYFAKAMLPGYSVVRYDMPL